MCKIISIIIENISQNTQDWNDPMEFNSHCKPQKSSKNGEFGEGEGGRGVCVVGGGILYKSCR